MICTSSKIIGWTRVGLLAGLLGLMSSCSATDDFWDDADGEDADIGTGALDAAKSVALHPGETKDAELVKTLPVGKSEKGAERRVVMRLGPKEIPSLAKGDRLITPAEVQVTTRCDVGQDGAGCSYSPQIRAQLILTGNPDDTDPDGAQSTGMSSPQTQTCTRAEHHCMFVFTPSDASRTLDSLPCVANDSCHVNLVMWAWHADARSGGQDKVLIGENEGNYLDNGVVGGDKGRLAVVRERGIGASDRVVRETGGGGTIAVNTNANPVLVYSHPLKGGGAGLEAGEQYIVEAKLVAEVANRARVSTLMFLTKNPSSTGGNGLDSTFPSAITEHNGINCTSGTSPCTARKVGVFRVKDDVAGPVYVNIVVTSAVPGGGSTSVKVKRGDGWIRSMRYDAELKGP